MILEAISEAWREKLFQLPAVAFWKIHLALCSTGINKSPSLWLGASVRIMIIYKFYGRQSFQTMDQDSFSNLNTPGWFGKRKAHWRHAKSYLGVEFVADDKCLYLFLATFHLGPPERASAKMNAVIKVSVVSMWWFAWEKRHGLRRGESKQNDFMYTSVGVLTWIRHTPRAEEFYIMMAQSRRIWRLPTTCIIGYQNKK